MANKSVSEIIADLQKISGEYSISHPEFSAKIDQKVLELQKIEKPSKTDQFIDRAKKVAEILASVAKIAYDCFKS